MSVFERFHPRLREAIVARLGWSSLRPVQEEAGRALLDGSNAVILAPTAGGKTEAAVFPALSLVMEEPQAGVSVLYVAPIKALLNNQAERLGLYAEMVGLQRFVWHGDTTSHERKKFLKDPAALLLTTPESLEVMLASPKVDEAALFAGLRVVIVDEIHALAGSDRGAHLMSVLERVRRLSRHDVQRAGLSATVGNPEAILDWLQGGSRRAREVVAPPRASGKRKLLVQHRPEMVSLAKEAARMARGHKSLFFCQSRSMAESVAGVMRQAGTEVFVHHSSVSREERQLAEEKFYRGQDACIVCTSTLELGIDVGDLDLVLQAESPDTVSAFLQRMGRTGRREGQTANTSFFCETREGMVQALALIELAKAGWVESVALQDRCWPVLLHQLLAMSLAEGGITLERAWEHLSKVPDFSGIHRAEFERLVRWMLRDGSLVLATGRLVLGPKAEKRFGRRNFMDLYAVFSSPQTYTVQTPAGQPLGSLSQSFVDRLTDGLSHFLLGGRAWSVVHINHKERIIQVEPAPVGSQPSWGGFLPQFIGREVCEAILGWLTSDKDSTALTPQAREALLAWRTETREVLEPGLGGLQVSDKEISWWTFAGGRINSTLRSALAAVGGDWKISADNFRLRIQGEHVEERTFRAALERLDEPDFWLDDKLWGEVAEGLPSYRLSKFQPLMPPWVEREVLAAYLLDLEGTRRWWDQHRQLPALCALPEPAPSAGAPQPSALPMPRVPLEPRPAWHEAPHEQGRPETDVPSARQPSLPVHWIADDEALARVCASLSSEAALALDVETALYKDTLCLVQMASRTDIYIIDPFEISDWGSLARLMSNSGVLKVIHNASFERRILAQHDIQINHVFDTLPVSRKLRVKAEGGHGLGVVCAREFGLPLDKAEQKSDWQRRPLTPSQRTYAALDVDVLLPLYDKFRAELDALGQASLL